MVRANAAVLARVFLTKVSLCLADAAHPAGFAHAVVVVHQLDAFLGAQRRARVGKAFVDISFAPWPHKSRRAFAVISTNSVDASSTVMTSSFEAVVNVDFAKEASSTMRTSTLEVIHEVMANAVVLAWIGLAIVDVELAILALVTLGAQALVRPNEVFASGSILARIAGAFVDLVLTVAAIIAFGANALMTIAHIAASSSVLAKLVNARQSTEHGGRVARHFSHIANFSRPSSLTLALESRASLDASASIFARRVTAPIHQLLAIVARPARFTMTGVLPITIVAARASIFARALIALGVGRLAVAPREPVGADASVVVDAIDASAAIHA